MGPRTCFLCHHGRGQRRLGGERWGSGHPDAKRALVLGVSRMFSPTHHLDFEISRLKGSPPPIQTIVTSRQLDLASQNQQGSAKKSWSWTETLPTLRKTSSRPALAVDAVGRCSSRMPSPGHTSRIHRAISESGAHSPNTSIMSVRRGPAPLNCAASRANSSSDAAGSLPWHRFSAW